ncbi:hypothetical protein SAMN05421547_14617, partial [Delftia lacustris]
CWLLAVGCWLLAVGCWLLAVGCWLLAVGCWLLAVGCWLLAVGCSPASPFCPRLRWAGCGVAALPKDRAASLSSLPQLFERIAPQAQGVSSAAHPASRPTQVARSEAKGRGQFGARFFAPLSCRATRKRVGRRAEPRPRKTTTRQGQKKTHQQTSKKGATSIPPAAPSSVNHQTEISERYRPEQALHGVDQPHLPAAPAHCAAPARWCRCRWTAH